MQELTIWLNDEATEQAIADQQAANDELVRNGYPNDRKTLREYVEWLINHTLHQRRIALRRAYENESKEADQ